MRQKVMLSLTKRHLEAIDWYARKKNMTRSEAIKDLIETKAMDLAFDPKTEEMQNILWRKQD